MKKRILKLFQLRNRHLFFADIVLLLSSPLVAMYLRTESVDEIISLALPLMYFTVITFVMKEAVFVGVGLYAQYWRYASVEEMVVLLKATAYTFAIEVALFFSVL